MNVTDAVHEQFGVDGEKYPIAVVINRSSTDQLSTQSYSPGYLKLWVAVVVDKGGNLVALNERLLDTLESQDLYTERNLIPAFAGIWGELHRRGLHQTYYGVEDSQREILGSKYSARPDGRYSVGVPNTYLDFEHLDGTRHSSLASCESMVVTSALGESAVLFDKTLQKKLEKFSHRLEINYFKDQYECPKRLENGYVNWIAFFFEKRKEGEAVLKYLKKTGVKSTAAISTKTDKKLKTVSTYAETVPVDSHIGVITNSRMLAEIEFKWKDVYDSGLNDRIETYVDKGFLTLGKQIAKKYKPIADKEYRVYISDKKFISMMKLDRRWNSCITRITFNKDRYKEVADDLIKVEL